MATGHKAKVLFSNSLLKLESLVHRLQKYFDIVDSSDLCDYSCFFPHCRASFLLVDYIKDLSHWVREEDKNGDQFIFSLANFVYTNSDPFIVFLAPQVDEQCLWVCYEAQRRIELITEKPALIWISTSWKLLSRYIISQVQALDLDKQQTSFCEDTERANVIFAEMQNYAKEQLKLTFSGDCQ